ncbi:hypothetical protein ACFVS2_20575 [Brevibacillus sp. NPDC058079]|uniref:hypothetical protein n=1 Tax=Brevibacillus sp. NPDC058079 TaxID=3346330 RepID=UPI0036E77BD0
MFERWEDRFLWATLIFMVNFLFPSYGMGNSLQMNVTFTLIYVLSDDISKWVCGLKNHYITMNLAWIVAVAMLVSSVYMYISATVIAVKGIFFLFTNYGEEISSAILYTLAAFFGISFLVAQVMFYKREQH